MWLIKTHMSPILCSCSFPGGCFFAQHCGICPEHHNLAFCPHFQGTMHTYELCLCLFLQIQLPSAFQASVSIFSALSSFVQHDCCTLLGFLAFVLQFRRYFRQKVEHYGTHLICFPSFRNYSLCVSIF